jgi:hypothetical protein
LFSEKESENAKLCFLSLSSSKHLEANDGSKASGTSCCNSKSILALERCFEQIEKTIKDTSTYVPYRDSILTQYLKEFINGDTLVSVIAHISSEPHCSFDTYNALLYTDNLKKASKSKSYSISPIEFTSLNLESTMENNNEEKDNPLTAHENQNARECSQNFRNIIEGFQSWKNNFEEEIDLHRSEIEELLCKLSETRLTQEISSMSGIKFELPSDNEDANHLHEKQKSFQSKTNSAIKGLEKLSDLASQILSASEYRKFNRIVNLAVAALKNETEKDYLKSYRLIHFVTHEL